MIFLYRNQYIRRATSLTLAEKKTFTNIEEEIKHDIQQVLLGMFMVCQFQFIIGKSETCSKDGLKKKSTDGWKVNEDSKMKKKFEDYDLYIDPKKIPGTTC
ncbi:MAG: hypothetical protein F3740_11455 [Nitrospinae bacterium]|nr:hypothetical protein [Nitrospinota bacterium]